jgi:hypothetical protein
MAWKSHAITALATAEEFVKRGYIALRTAWGISGISGNAVVVFPVDSIGVGADVTHCGPARGISGISGISGSAVVVLATRQRRVAGTAGIPGHRHDGTAGPPEPACHLRTIDAADHGANPSAGLRSMH